MPVSRPSSPASLSGTDVVALNADQIWLVDTTSGSTIPDLKGGTGLTIGNATYTTDATIGRSLVSSGSGVQADMVFASPGTGISNYPIGGGAVIIGGTSSGVGADAILYYVDSLQDTTPLWMRLFISNAFNAFVVSWDSIAGDSPSGQMNGSVSYAPSTQFAIAWWIDSNSTGCFSINGTNSTSVATAEANSGWDATLRLGQISVLAGRSASGGSVFDVGTYTKQALWWRAHGSTARTAITNAAMATWTADPWTILASSTGRAGALAGTFSGVVPTAGGTLAISGHLT